LVDLLLFKIQLSLLDLHLHLFFVSGDQVACNLAHSLDD
jgi:hypothetical protein